MRSKIRRLVLSALMLILPSFAFAVDYWQNLEDVGADFGYVCPITANTPNCDTSGLSTVTSSSAFLKMDSQNGYKWFNFLWFNVASPILPNAGDVDKVYLWMYRRPSLSGLPASWVYMDMREVKFTSGITWQQFATNNSQATPPVPAQYFYCATDNTWCTVDITAQYKAWRAGQYPNGGFFMQSSVSSGYSNWFLGPKTVVDPAWKPRLQFQLKAGVNPPVTSADPYRFLAFPLKNAGYMRWDTAPLVSVMDHAKTSTAATVPGNVDSNTTVTAFNGESASNYPGNYLTVWCPYRTSATNSLTHPAASAPIPYLGDSTAGCLGTSTLSYNGHNGFDYAVPANTPVYSSAPGVVTENQCTGVGGTCPSTTMGRVIVKHVITVNGVQKTYYTWYMHLAKAVRANGTTYAVGSTLGEGEQLGLSGATGAGSAYHLHFEVRIGGNGTASNYGVPVDPFGWYGTGQDPLNTTTGYQQIYTSEGHTNRLLWK